MNKCIKNFPFTVCQSHQAMNFKSRTKISQIYPKKRKRQAVHRQATIQCQFLTVHQFNFGQPILFDDIGGKIKILFQQETRLTVLIGPSTLYSKLNTSHPVSPGETSNSRTSSLLRMSLSSYCALVALIALSKMPVRLCRKRLLAGLARSSLATHKQ